MVLNGFESSGKSHQFKNKESVDGRMADSEEEKGLISRKDVVITFGGDSGGRALRSIVAM